MTLPNAVVKNGEEGGQIGGQISLTTRQQQILALIRKSPAISRTEMVQKLKISESPGINHPLINCVSINRLPATNNFF